MSDYTVLKSSREELLKKAGYAERHILYKLAVEGKSKTFEIEAESNTIKQLSAK